MVLARGTSEGRQADVDPEFGIGVEMSRAVASGYRGLRPFDLNAETQGFEALELDPLPVDEHFGRVDLYRPIQDDLLAGPIARADVYDRAIEVLRSTAEDTVNIRPFQIAGGGLIGPLTAELDLQLDPSASRVDAESLFQRHSLTEPHQNPADGTWWRVAAKSRFHRRCPT